MIFMCWHFYPDFVITRFRYCTWEVLQYTLFCIWLEWHISCVFKLSFTWWTLRLKQERLYFINVQFLVCDIILWRVTLYHNYLWSKHSIVYFEGNSKGKNQQTAFFIRGTWDYEMMKGYTQRMWIQYRKCENHQERIHNNSHYFLKTCKLAKTSLCNRGMIEQRKDTA